MGGGGEKCVEGVEKCVGSEGRGVGKCRGDEESMKVWGSVLRVWER